MRTIKTYILLAMVVGFVSCSSDEPKMTEGEKIPAEELTPSGNEFVAFELTDVESRAAQETATFDVEFFKAVCVAEADESVVAVSPLSARILMAMVANAANEEAAAEIVGALGCSDLKALNTLSGKYLNALGSVDPTATIQMANGVWYHEAYTLADVFKSAIEGDFGSETHAVDLYTESTRNLINGWVAEKTCDKIQSILDNVLSEPTVTVLANALYFKGEWSNPFDECETTDDVFNGVMGKSIVKMMYNKEYQHYRETATYSAVRMDMGKDGKLTATFVLPKEGVDLNEFVANLDFSEMEGEYSFMDETIEFSLPKFKVVPAKEYNLNHSLSLLGITKIQDILPSPMFTANKSAKFDVFQKATVEVAEQGAEGAAVTWSYMCTSPGPEYVPEIPKVVFDRPFLMYISHPETKAILLAARVGAIQ
ncbi:MAG: hypothetical protein K2M55_08100 [Muribaculaceae bacterium]|nr:hypothetical protein [Muribaculaceae bacterium]